MSAVIRKDYELFLVNNLNKYLSESLANYQLPKDIFVVFFSYETLENLELQQQVADLVNILRFHGEKLSKQTFYIALIKIIATTDGKKEYCCLDCVSLKEQELLLFLGNPLLAIPSLKEQQVLCSNILTIFAQTQANYFIQFFTQRNFEILAHKTFLTHKERQVTIILQLQEDVKISQSMLSWLYQNFGITSIIGYQKINEKKQVILRLTLNF